MKEPTNEQIKEFWEWCGFKYHTYPELWHLGRIEIEGARWITPDGKAAILDAPKIDLNNLFKYAVPKLQEKYPDLKIIFSYIGGELACILQVWGKESSIKKNWKWNILSIGKGDNEPTALFWTIWEVIPPSVKDSSPGK